MSAAWGSPDATTRESASPNIRLSLSNRPENVMLVRQVLAGFGEATGMDSAEINDISTAVTEACNNVVLHAYRGAEGVLEVDIQAARGSIVVAVRDNGTGIRDASPGVDGMGMGLSVIRALTEQADVIDGVRGGTEIGMSFATASAVALAGAHSAEPKLPEIPVAALPSTVELAIAPVALAGAVLSRLLGALAARSHFRTDRIADMRLVADAFADAARELTTGTHLRVGASMEPHRIELRFAPLVAGGASRLMDSRTRPVPVLSTLSDWHRVSPIDGDRAGEGEMLVVGMLDAH